MGKDIQDLEDREGFLKNAIENALQSSLLLSQMEAEAKSKLQQEVARTNDLFHKLSGRVNQFLTKLAKEEEKLSQIPLFQDSIAMEEKLGETRRKLAEEKVRVAELKKFNDERKRGTMAGRKTGSWSDFVQECVNLSECWLEKRDKLIQADSAPGRKADPIELDLPSDSDEDMEAESEPDQDPETLPDISKVSLNSGLISSVNDPKSFPKSTESPSFMPMPTSRPLEGESLMEDLSSVGSKEASVEPPTPKTKSLHLKLGTSLLTLKKSRQQSRGPSPVTSASQLIKSAAVSPRVDLYTGSKVKIMEKEPRKEVIGNNDKNTNDDKTKRNSWANQASKPRRRPSSPIPRLLKAFSPSKSSDEGSSSKQRSFKLGLPSLSLFPKKNTKQSEVVKVLTQEEDEVQSIPPLKTPVLQVQSTPLPPPTAANFGPKLALAPAPPVPSSKADIPRPKPISKSGLRVDQANKEEVKLITPVKAGSKSPPEDHDLSVIILSPPKIRRTPEKNDQEDVETEKEVFYSSDTPRPKPISKSS